MIYGYIRVSTNKQSVDNQRFEILKFANTKKIHVDQWVEETVSGAKKYKDRKLGELIRGMEIDDVLIVTEVSRLGRNLMEVMSVLHDCMELDAKVFTTKEGYELGNNISSKVLAFAFGLSAEIERNMISQRTKEALSKKKSEGKKLGRPKGRKSKETKLTGKEDTIRELLQNKVSIAAIGRILRVHRLTVDRFIKNQNISP